MIYIDNKVEKGSFVNDMSFNDCLRECKGKMLYQDVERLYKRGYVELKAKSIMSGLLEKDSAADVLNEWIGEYNEVINDSL